MLRNILVPLDGSSRAERALPVATRLAQVSGGTVVLLRVVHFSTEFVPHPEADPGKAQWRCRARQISTGFSLSDWPKATKELIRRDGRTIADSSRVARKRQAQEVLNLLKERPGI